MKTFIFCFWSNKKIAHEEKLFECVAPGILEADKQFEQTTGLNPIKCPWVGCTFFIEGT